MRRRRRRLVRGRHTRQPRPHAAPLAASCAAAQLVLLEMSDRHHRTASAAGRAGAGAAATPASQLGACGFVFGIQSGMRVELMATCDLHVVADSGKPVIDAKMSGVLRELGAWPRHRTARARACPACVETACLAASGSGARRRATPSPSRLSPTLAVSAVYPSYEMLGWYAIGPKLTQSHMDVHLQVTALNESPLFLLLNPTALAAEARELPLAIHMVTCRLIHPPRSCCLILQDASTTCRFVGRRRR